MGSGFNRFRQVGGFGRKAAGSTPTPVPAPAPAPAASSPRAAAEPAAPPPLRGRLFGRGESGASASSPFARFLEASAEEPTNGYGYQAYQSTRYMTALTPEERGALLVDLADRKGVYGGVHDNSPEARAAYNAYWTVWKHEIAVDKEHLPGLLRHLLDNPAYRKEAYLETQLSALLKLIADTIAQGAYLSSGDCEAIGVMAADIRAKGSYRKANTKKLIARAERLEKLAGVEVSGTELLMQRCEGAENPYEISAEPRPNAQFWADLLAEVAGALDEIRRATKGGTKPAWAGSEAAFAAQWPACGSVEPSLQRWKAGGQPVDSLKADNGKRNGWADPAAYRRLPEWLDAAAAHSRYLWKSDQIPGLDVLADLENPAWTALVEHLITQRRTPRAPKGWQKQALALCKPVGLAEVEARLHDWLALFHSPVLGREGFTDVVNGERFAAAINRLEAAHPDWPQAHAHETRALGRAVAITVASGGNHGLASDFQPRLVRLDDHMYKNRSATTGVLGLLNPSYRNAQGNSTYETLSSWMRVSVENEDFLRGALWLVALMPDRARAITALERIALSAATYCWTGDEGMRSKIIANAAIATLIDLGGPDIDAAVLRLSKGVEHQTVRAPLLDYLGKTG